MSYTSLIGFTLTSLKAYKNGDKLPRNGPGPGPSAHSSSNRGPASVSTIKLDPGLYSRPGLSSRINGIGPANSFHTSPTFYTFLGSRISILPTNIYTDNYCHLMVRYSLPQQQVNITAKDATACSSMSAIYITCRSPCIVYEP